MPAMQVSTSSHDSTVASEFHSNLVYSHKAPEHDLVIIGGGVAGYVAAIKAGQQGLKVRGQSGCSRLSLHLALRS